MFKKNLSLLIAIDKAIGTVIFFNFYSENLLVYIA